ncbi:MAG: chemotaxis response regulator protein-glutamate methylesterase [Lutisporaceae bacterium]
MNTPKKKIKVLVVDDSAFMRKVISDILANSEDIEVVGAAKNGRDGVYKAKVLKPDVVTLDVEMPVMDGLSALTELLQLTPAPKVIMLSSLTNNGGEITIRALEAGAVDFVTKPTSSIIHFDIEDIKEDLIKKIKNSIYSNTLNFSRYSNISSKLKNINDAYTKTCPVQQSNLKHIVCIGISTGGPRALREVITQLPADLPAAVLVVQHMPSGFTKSLATRLDALSNINVKEAEDGDILKPGWVYIAPGDFQMMLNKKSSDYRININQDPPMSGHRPSVNYMMNSVASCGHKSLIAVMMTGMGSDGSDGIANIKNNGGSTIAQNEETCIVYGMPKAAVNTGAIDKIVPLSDIAKEIIKLTGV